VRDVDAAEATAVLGLLLMLGGKRREQACRGLAELLDRQKLLSARGASPPIRVGSDMRPSRRGYAPYPWVVPLPPPLHLLAHLHAMGWVCASDVFSMVETYMGYMWPSIGYRLPDESRGHPAGRARRHQRAGGVGGSGRAGLDEARRCSGQAHRAEPSG
jgi:hypothetical protein